MALSTVNLRWNEGHLMTGVDSRGTPLVIGTWPEPEPNWKGLKPSDLLLLAAASCASYDVITILIKQRQPLEGLQVRCSGEQEDDPPYRFARIHIHYILKGALNPKKVDRAIQLSELKYCSVTNTLRASVEIVCDFEII